MKNSNRKLSLIMAIILLFNFVMPSLSLAGFEAETDEYGHVYGAISLDKGESASRRIQGDHITFSVAETGLYTITLDCHYTISNNYDHMGGNLGTLAAATYEDENGSLNHPELLDGESHKVTVFLKAGVNYNIMTVAQIESGTEISEFSVSVDRQNVEESQIRELKTTSVHDEDYGAAKYTLYGCRL